VTQFGSDFLRSADLMPLSHAKLILVTGATGYVGGRLVPRLLAAGYRVRCLVRDPARLQGRAWLDQVELAPGDMLQPASLSAAMREVSVVYYLIHSLGGGGDFSERDLVAARNCASAAKSAGRGANHLSGRTRRSAGRTVTPLALASGDGHSFARGGRAGDGISRGGDCRFRQSFI